MNDINFKIYEDFGDYSVIGVEHRDIINDIDFDNAEDKLICSEIINSIERFASENIQNNKAVALPSVGCLRKSIYRQAVVKSGINFSNYRKAMSCEDYKEFTKSFFSSIKQNDIKHRKQIKKQNDIKRIFKKQYDYYVRNISKSYADMFIFAVSNLTGVEYDDELNYQLMKVLNGKD